MIFSELNSLLDIVAKLRNSRGQPKNPELSICDRFIGVFQKHGVGRNQIPRFLDDGLTVADIQNEDTLLPKLTEERLNRVCSLLAIKRGWLDGTEEAIFPEYFFYKHPEDFADFLTHHKIDYCYLLYPKSQQDMSAALILKESIGFVEDREIYRFHVESDWVFNYWKCRAYIAAIFSMVEAQQGISFYAQTLAPEIQGFLTGIEEVHELGFAISKRDHGYKLFESLDSFSNGLGDDREVSLGISLMRALFNQGWVRAEADSFLQEFR
tara:strand:+ start:523 stop:1323 length:801 start_codon:yes stop_codon:yes gene_type:complete